MEDRFNSLETCHNAKVASKHKKAKAAQRLMAHNQVTQCFRNFEGLDDIVFYSSEHMPMAARLLTDSLKSMSSDRRSASGTPDMPATYVAVGYFYFETMSSFQNATGPISEKLKAIFQNYTNIQPVIQIN